MTTPDTPLDCDGFAAALAEYLDAAAPDALREAVELHAASCAGCSQLLADLSAIRYNAASLPVLVPSRDLWEGIAGRIESHVIPLEAGRMTRGLPASPRWTRPALAAAALVAITAGITHMVARASLAPVASPVQVAVTPAPTVSSVAPSPTSVDAAIAAPPILATTGERASSLRTAPRPTSTPTRLATNEPLMSDADPVYASEISKLRRIVRERRTQLDPATIALLEQSIAVIDSAIAQSRAALVNDPASGFLATQLNHSLDKKVELLRTAATLPART